MVGMKGWNIHYCLLDKHCRSFNSPPRLHLSTPRGTLVLTIPPWYRTLDLNSVLPHDEGEVPTLTGKKVWAWEWPFLIRKTRQ